MTAEPTLRAMTPNGHLEASCSCSRGALEEFESAFMVFTIYLVGVLEGDVDIDIV